MKKFLFALLLLPFISKAQVLPIGASKGTVRVLGKLSSDTLLILPNSDTTTAPKILGGVIMKTSDKKIYVYTGTKWAATSEGAVVSESDPTVPAFLKLIVPADTVRWAMAYVDSVKRVGLNVYTYKNGAATLAYTDSIANVSGKLDSIRRSSDSVYWYAGGSRFFAFKDSTGGEANTGANIGSGAQVFQAKVGLELRFKTILSGNGNITITPGTNDITLTGKSFVDSVRKKAGTDSVFFYTNGTGSFGFKDSAIAGGEINTISSVGAGTSIVKGKTGVDLQLKSLTSDTTIALTGNTNDVQVKVDQTRISSVKRLQDTATAIRATIAAGDTIYVKNAGDSGLSLFYIQGDTLKFKRINGATQNADSSISINATGGGGVSGLTNNRIPYAASSTTIADDGTYTFNTTTKEVTLKKLIVTNNDGEATPNGAVVFNGTFTGGTEAGHAIVNQRVYSRSTGAIAFIDDGGSSTVTADHTITLQSRPSHTGGTLTTFHGAGVYPTVSSTGVATNIWNYTARSAVNNGTTTENVAYNVEAPTLAGSGAITNSYGLKVASLTNATNNYSIFTGTAQSYFGGTVRVPSGELILNDLSGTNNVPFTLGNTANNTYPSINYNAGLRVNSGKFLVSDIALKMDMNATGFVFKGSNTGTAGGTITFTDLLTVPIGNAATLGNLILHNGQFQVNSNTPAYFGAKSSSDYPELTYNYDLRGNAYKITDEAYRFRLDNGFKYFITASGTAGTAPTWTEIARLTDAGEFFLGSLTDNGAFTLQNTGGLYQQGSFRLGGTRAATSNDVKLLVKGESDSTVAALDFPIVQTSYSPTKTDVTNIGTASVTTSYYQRTGNKIEVWGEVTIDPTATGDTQITLSLPIASSMSNSYDLSGSAAAYDVNQSARIYYSGGVAVVRLNAGDASSHVYSYRYVYYYFAP